MNRIIAAIIATIAINAHADEWTGKDKQFHFVAHIASGAVTRAVFPNLTDTEAIAVATIPGIIKELHDSRPGGTGFSYKDMAWNIAGAFVGVKATGWILSKQNDTIKVSYSTEF